MRIIWEEGDVKARRIVVRDTERCMIGETSEAAEARFVIVSLDTGHVTRACTRAEIAHALTELGYLPSVLADTTHL